jgi:choline dehydrogenase
MYDYVIVGAGSAGRVLANRLSADPANKVLLLEAGGSDDSPLIHTPAMMALLPDTNIDWRYRTAPQMHCNMRRFAWPRGRVLGGSSSINYMIYIRGHARDYDHWRQLGNPGWSYKDVLPYFRKAENNERMENQFHGRGGPLNVADHRFRHLCLHKSRKCWANVAFLVPRSYRRRHDRTSVRCRFPALVPGAQPSLTGT